MKAIYLNNHLHYITGLILFAFCFLSFEIKHTEINPSPLKFEEINFNIELVNNNDENLEYKLISDGLDLKLDIDLETESCILTVKGKTVLTDFNYFYDTDLESAIAEIKVLKSSDGNAIVILLPTTTEEFLTFQLIEFESQSNTFKKGLFEINTHEYDNVRNFYLDNKIILTQVNDSFEISLSDFRYKEVFTKLKTI